MDHSVQKTTPYRVISVLLLVVLAVLMIFPLYWIITRVLQGRAHHQQRHARLVSRKPYNRQLHAPV